MMFVFCSCQHSNHHSPQSESQTSTEIRHGRISLPLFGDDSRSADSHFGLPNVGVGSGLVSFLVISGSLYRPHHGQFKDLPHRFCHYHATKERGEEKSETFILHSSAPDG